MNSNRLTVNSKARSKINEKICNKLQSRVVREIDRTDDEAVCNGFGHLENNSFKNAHHESERLESIAVQQRMRLMNFDMNIKKRLKEYRDLEEHKLNENLNDVKIRTRSYTDRPIKFRALSAGNDGSPRETSPGGFLAAENHALIRRQLNESSKRTQKQLIQKRIESTRKLYSDMERLKVTSLISPRSKSADKQPKPNPSKLAQASKAKVKCELDSNFRRASRKLESAPGTVRSLPTNIETETTERLKVRQNNIPAGSASSKEPMTTQIANKGDRQMNYLKNMLRDKLVQLKLTELPPLCQCYLTNSEQDEIFSLDSCANNCLFYKNPKGKVKLVLN